MVKRAVEMEGTVTGEHGVGIVKRDYLDHELGQSTVDLMRKVSQISKIPPMTTDLLITYVAERSLRSTLPSELRQSSPIEGPQSRGGSTLVTSVVA